MTSYTPSQLRKKFKKEWVMAYQELTAVVDERSGQIMYIENYGPTNGFFIEGWRALHFPLTSSLVKKSYREGSITIYVLSQGTVKLRLTPSFAPIGIEQCRLIGNTVCLTFSGIGGGGVSAAYSRGMSKGVIKTKIINDGGGNRHGTGQIFLPKKHLLLIGVDDTDNENEGATYSLIHNITVMVCKKYNVAYVIHNNVQLYPYNPHKTKNCMSTVVGIIYEKPSQRKRLTNEIVRNIKRLSLSTETGIAVYDGFSLPQEFREFCHSLKFRILTEIKELYQISEKYGVALYPKKNRRGLIGAVAALGFFDDPEFAAKLPSQCI